MGEKSRFEMWNQQESDKSVANGISKIGISNIHSVNAFGRIREDCVGEQRQEILLSRNDDTNPKHFNCSCQKTSNSKLNKSCPHLFCAVSGVF
mmetsp:Transcript_10529/g.30811  ORF Transcript_10529/g.30811 Transcript_10529/m.30811 type:complete len:93 (-) Transcript_10529:1402-1680(-)